MFVANDAKIKMICRKSPQRIAQKVLKEFSKPPMSIETKNLYEFGSFRFDAEKRTLWREDEVVSLPPKALELLKLLIEKKGEIASKQEIFEKVWADTFVEEGVLTQNIYTLRQALGTDENGKQLIENLARRGYRLTVVVTVHKISDELRQTENPVEKSANIQPKSRQYLSFYVVIPLFVLSFLGYFGYRYLTTTNESLPQKQNVELKFKQLTDTGDTSYLTMSPDGNWVAFTRGFDVYLRNLEGNTETKLPLEKITKVGCLQFSFDGKSLFLGTMYNRDEPGNVFRVTTTDGKAELVAENVWSGFSISPDGQELAFIRKFPNQNKQDLIIKHLVTSAEKTLKSLSLPEEFYWNNYPAWSADGTKIALVAVNQTEHFSRLIILENGAERELKLPNFRNVEQIVWNAEANSLIASANDGNNFQLWKILLADGSYKRITNDLNSYLGIAVSQDRKKLGSRQRIYYSNIWTAQSDNLSNLKQQTTGTSRNDGLNGLTWFDDEKIVYATNDEKIRDWNLWMLNTADGSKQKLTADSEKQNDFPTISPDKKTIYFSSDRNKQSRIWRINADGSNPQQITFGEDETHHFPQISPDGNHLYFIIKSGRSSTIGRKSLNENSVQELSGKTNYTAGNFLSLSPDGKLLAFQNINFQTKSEPENLKLQIALLSTENPQDVQLKEINAWRQNMVWTFDNKNFDYVNGNFKQSGIYRQSLENDASPMKLLETNDAIFNFSWSPNGKTLAISRGQLLRDVVLLSNFE